MGQCNIKTYEKTIPNAYLYIYIYIYIYIYVCVCNDLYLVIFPPCFSFLKNK